MGLAIEKKMGLDGEESGNGCGRRWGRLLVWERNRGNGEPWVCGRGRNRWMSLEVTGLPKG